MSTTTDSSTSYSSFSTASVSTQPTEVALSSSCEETGGESDAAAAPKAPSRLLQRASTAQTSRVVTEFPPLQGRFRSSSVIVPPSPVGPDFQRDLTQQPPTSSSLGSIASTPKTQQQLGRKPATPIPRHMVTPETPIIFAQRPGVTTPPLSYLYPGSKPPTSLPSSYPATPATPAYTDSESTGRRAPAVASIDKLSSYYQPSKDGLLCHADGRGGSRAGSSAGNALLPSPIDPYNVPEPQTSQRERERTTSSAISVTGSQRTSQLSGSSLSLASSSFVHVNLPAKIAFLRDTIIELHIDQEGFRAIKPKFRLYRHSYTSFKSSTPDLVGPQLGTSSAVMAPNPSYLTRHSRSDSRATGTGPSALGSCFEDDYYGEYGLVEFRMTTRDTFIFHHAKFDSPPTLRRVTLNGDESKDYISREASLSLKENGVYTAQGWEDKAKLFWKLEYLVDDRKATNGLDVHGEKTLTPMTFTCSPFLLDPERGKKIGVFQVVKKSITPKISSSKLRPPKVVSPPKARSVSAKVEGSKSESAAPPLPSIPVHQTPKQPLSRMPNQNVDPATIHDISSIHSSGVRSAFSKILSRPSTPARPGTPKRPKTPNKRPSTASKAIGPSEPSPVDEVADPFAKLAPSNFTASDWARRAANATANRPRAVSAAAQRPALFSSPMNFDLDTLPSLAQLSSRGARTNVQPTGSFATSSDKAAPSLPMPHLPGPIVPPQQLEQWMSDTQKSSGGLLSLPPPRGLGSTPRPLLPKRPSTASNDGRPWNKS
ncbi:hypothetical protein FRB90_002767 [Tulasnella sp. 427]|nr:hypothetical protein FRB90_002767 [Tulasnella sp. 427]